VVERERSVMIDAPPLAPAPPTLPAHLVAEAAGTFLLVFALVGAATSTAVFPDGRNTLGMGRIGRTSRADDATAELDAPRA
jgi:aquaporin Z